MYLFQPLHLSLFFSTHTLARTSRNTLATDTIFSIPRVGKLWHIGQIQLSACSCITHGPRTFAIDVILETFTLTPLKQNFIPKHNFILFFNRCVCFQNCTQYYISDCIRKWWNVFSVLLWNESCESYCEWKLCPTLKRHGLYSPWNSPGQNTGVGQSISSVLSDSLWPCGLQHARPPCPSPTPRVYSNSCPLSRWCHPTISSSVGPFSSCLQSFPASGSF